MTNHQEQDVQAELIRPAAKGVRKTSPAGWILVAGVAVGAAFLLGTVLGGRLKRR